MEPNSKYYYPDKVVFLDRDGVINKKAAPHEYITNWDEFQLLPKVTEALRLLKDAGYLLIIVSNQRGISLGKMSKNDVDQIHFRLNNVLIENGTYIDSFFYCPHDINECSCRKPGIGLFLSAEKYYCINKSQSWMIGDSLSDIVAGKKYGVKTIYIGNSNKLSPSFPDLYEAAVFITKC